MSAPPGSAYFQPSDVARLPAATLRVALAPGPSAPPAEDIASALAPDDLARVALALDPARGERLLRLGQRPVPPEQRAAAGGRLVRGLFWPLVYELEPERWAELAELERLPEGLVDDMPAGKLAVEVGAGTGRLTALLAERSQAVVACDLSRPLAKRLRARRLARVIVLAASWQALPLPDGCADLAAACAALAPDPPLAGEATLVEMERVTRPGGWVAVVGPEAPEWLQARGYARRDYPPQPAAAPVHVVEFFGPVHPPRTLLLKQV